MGLTSWTPLTGMSKQIDFNRIEAKLEKMGRTLPKMLANKTLNFTKDNFRKQGFDDGGVSPWAGRKRGNAADRRTNKNRAILVDSGALRRSLAIKKATFREIRVGSYGIAYASRHNRGLAGMPQRKFIGPSATLRKKWKETAAREFKKALTP